jgi:hypothetical protein
MPDSGLLILGVGVVWSRDRRAQMTIIIEVPVAPAAVDVFNEAEKEISSPKKNKRKICEGRCVDHYGHVH